MSKRNWSPYLIVGAVLLYLLLPLLATLLYSFSTKWQATILPENWTFEWFQTVLRDERFWIALGRSFTVCCLTLAVHIIVMVPTAFLIAVYFPKLEKVMNVLVMLPFAMPGVVMAVGLLKLYSSGPLPIAGTVWILIGSYFTVGLPYMYQGIRNSLKNMDLHTLMEAAELLKATKVKAFLYVVLPNISKGVLVATLLTFSVLFGEFVLANILAGGGYETIQVYLYSKNQASGHFTSVIVISYFVFIALISGIIIKLNSLANKEAQ